MISRWFVCTLNFEWQYYRNNLTKYFFLVKTVVKSLISPYFSEHPLLSDSSFPGSYFQKSTVGTSLIRDPPKSLQEKVSLPIPARSWKTQSKSGTYQNANKNLNLKSALFSILLCNQGTLPGLAVEWLGNSVEPIENPIMKFINSIFISVAFDAGVYWLWKSRLT